MQASKGSTLPPKVKHNKGETKSVLCLCDLLCEVQLVAVAKQNVAHATTNTNISPCQLPLYICRTKIHRCSKNIVRWKHLSCTFKLVRSQDKLSMEEYLLTQQQWLYPSLVPGAARRGKKSSFSPSPFSTPGNEASYTLASFPGPHPLNHTASDKKLGEGLGTRLVIPHVA